MILEASKEDDRGALTEDMVMLEIIPQRKASRSEFQQFSLVALLPNVSLTSTGHVGHKSNASVDKHVLDFRVAASFTYRVPFSARNGSPRKASSNCEKVRCRFWITKEIRAGNVPRPSIKHATTSPKVTT